MSAYILDDSMPSAKEYCHLRAKSGLTPKTVEAARLALPNTWFGVQVMHEGAPVGMGRIMGDGGCHFQVVDVAVLPRHQGKGLGKRIMSSLMEYFENNAPKSAHISLIADGTAKDLYHQFGFEPTAPKSIGMSLLKE